MKKRSLRDAFWPENAKKQTTEQNSSSRSDTPQTPLTVPQSPQLPQSPQSLKSRLLHRITSHELAKVIYFKIISYALMNPGKSYKDYYRNIINELYENNEYERKHVLSLLNNVLLDVIEQECELINRNRTKLAQEINIEITRDSNGFISSESLNGYINFEGLRNSGLSMPAVGIISGLNQAVSLDCRKKDIAGFVEDKNSIFTLVSIMDDDDTKDDNYIGRHKIRIYNLWYIKAFATVFNRFASISEDNRFNLKEASLEEHLLNELRNNRESRMISPLTSNGSLNDYNILLNDHQKEAINDFMLLDDSNMMNVIGPPGCGKSKFIVNLATRLSLLGYKVLCISNTNIAIEQLLISLKNIENITYTMLVNPDTYKNNKDEKKQAYRAELYSSEIDVEDEARKAIRKNNIILSTIYAVGYYVRHMTGAGVQPPLAVIVDESSKLSILDFLFLIYTIQKTMSSFKFLFVGDNKQLAPFNPIKNNKGGAVSNSQSLINQSSFDYLLKCNDVKKIMFSHIYRISNPALKIVSDAYYEGRLVEAKKELPKTTKLSILRHNGEEELNQNTASFKNTNEAGMIIDYLKKNFNVNDKKIAIISMYKEQKDYIESLINKETSLRGKIDVHTVDSTQGSEYEIVFISMARSTSSEFAEDSRRMFVSLTRGSEQTIIVLSNKYQPKTREFQQIIYNAESITPIDTFPEISSLLLTR